MICIEKTNDLVTYQIVTNLIKLFSFENNEGYSVGKFLVVSYSDDKVNELLDSGNIITLSGYNLPNNRNISYDMVITPYYHPKYGKQGRVISVKDHPVQSKAGIINYLVKGPLDGIGPTLAERIYAAFGEDTIRVINEEPEKLLTIEGIGDQKLYQISKSRKEHQAVNTVMELLIPHGFSAGQCAKIAQKFGAVTESLAKYDPWRFTEISGVSFEICDAYAKKNGSNLNSDSRIRAGILETLKQNEKRGNVGENNSEMAGALKSLLGSIDISHAMCIADEMRKHHMVRTTNFNKHPLIYRNCAYQSECKVAVRSVQLSQYSMDNVSEQRLDAIIRDAERDLHMIYAGRQKAAAKACARNPLVILTGGPGTGKTTTERLIIYVLKRLSKEKNGKECTFAMLAPTGKAAKQMSIATGYPAQTIDSKLELYGEGEDTVNNDIIILEDVTVVDEASMLDVYKAAALFSAIQDGNRLIFVGDVDQLPSVGPGQVLKDMIDAGIPTVRLERVYRQQGAEGEVINENATRINAGRTDLLDGNGCWFLECDDDRQLAALIVRSYLIEVKKFGVEETVCLLPTKKTPYVGVYDMNAAIQAQVNPSDGRKSEIKFFNTVFREDDLVMNLKNDKEKNVVNGDVGKVIYCGLADNVRTVTVAFDRGKIAVYKGTEDLKNLILAYCMTVHKSQGSEYKSVIFGISKNLPACMKRKQIVYTAVSRAKKELILLGSRKSLDDSIRSKEGTAKKRNTSLSPLIRWYKEKELRKLANANPFAQ